MKDKQPSDTYKMLYNFVISDTLFQICNGNRDYCVKYFIDNDILPIAIWKKFQQYEENASKNMSGIRLDRHKLASCICGAIIEIRPLTGNKGKKIPEKANELLALYIGLNVIKVFMMFDILKEIPLEQKDDVKRYLKNNFNMCLPPLNENICDTQEYRKNILNALYWSHSKCDILQKECFHFDIWAYANIFYHLELYNRNNMQKCYQEYIKHKPIN